jgi:hypothetical protein
MIIIAHRGLLEGPNSKLENHPAQIERAIEENFNVEIDVRVIENRYFLGHDNPDFEVGEDWLNQISPFTWFHCKNVEALLKLRSSKIRSVHYFWHEEDTLTLTNKGFIWVYPGKQPIKQSIAVMPELHNDDVSQCFGICTDYSYDYRKRYDI